jgi:hypothetical protein
LSPGKGIQPPASPSEGAAGVQSWQEGLKFAKESWEHALAAERARTHSREGAPTLGGNGTHQGQEAGDVQETRRRYVALAFKVVRDHPGEVHDAVTIDAAVRHVADRWIAAPAERDELRAFIHSRGLVEHRILRRLLDR